MSGDLLIPLVTLLIIAFALLIMYLSYRLIVWSLKPRL